VPWSAVVMKAGGTERSCPDAHRGDVPLESEHKQTRQWILGELHQGPVHRQGPALCFTFVATSPTPPVHHQRRVSTTKPKSAKWAHMRRGEVPAVADAASNSKGRRRHALLPSSERRSEAVQSDSLERATHHGAFLPSDPRGCHGPGRFGGPFSREVLRAESAGRSQNQRLPRPTMLIGPRMYPQKVARPDSARGPWQLLPD
jgi:hypothetical protein